MGRTKAFNKKKIRRMNDFISQLPDEILHNIISHLSLNEAAATSILSARWRHQWKTVDYPTFDIDLPHLISISTRNKSLGKSRIVSLVSAILDQYQGSIIQELKIRFPTTQVVSFWSSEDMSPFFSWINTAFQRRVRNLVLDLQVFVLNPIDLDLLPSNFVSLVSLRLVGFKYLLGDALIHCFLSSCRSLQVLCIDRFVGLENLKICSSELKRLTISDSYVNFLEISAPSLVSFEFRHISGITVCFKDAPSLKQISLEGYNSYEHLLSKNLSPILGILSQLDSLALTQRYDSNSTRRRRIRNFPVLKNLKQLQLSEFRLTEFYYRDLAYTLIPLLQASPELLKLSLINFQYSFNPLKSVLKPFPMCSHRHQCLEVVEIVGFGGSDHEIELVKFLADYAASSMKKIIVHAANSKRLRQLKRRLPSTVVVELQII
ncbi:putative F-box/LRR-repeat protein At5g02700 [Mercurialis annua]|uniref:putative F-box/LRR-repeat protein At5g02700 n=1 Tax=Mercurialis annua TaxID=3986 RepID=UPI00215E764C|nr:putative F-box/LRR-repeat protein At5g02700 [Mercurialis annua]